MLVEYAAKWAWRLLGGSPGNVLFTLIVFAGVFAAVRSAQWLKFARSLPPGPWGLPVVGYLPFLRGDIHLQFGELAKKYGSMFSARLGSQLVVVLSDYRAIRDTFRREEFNGRPHNEFMNILGGYGESPIPRGASDNSNGPGRLFHRYRKLGGGDVEGAAQVPPRQSPEPGDDVPRGREEDDGDEDHGEFRVARARQPAESRNSRASRAPQVSPVS